MNTVSQNPITGRARTITRPLCLLAAAAVTLAGCAASAGSSHTGSSQQGMPAGMVMPGGSTPSDGQMTAGMVMPDGSTMAPGSPGTAPSTAAKMICTDETRANIATVLSVAPAADPAPTWKGDTYTCTYRLSAGSIVMSVHESADDTAATAYTAGLRRTLAGAENLAGLTANAFGTPNGVVVLQKDNDTLRVDTSALSPQSGRLYAHRNAFAYEIAAITLGCWTGS